MEDKRYAFIAEGDVFGFIEVPGNSLQAERYNAGFNSNATVIDITDNPDVTVGWIWDGKIFKDPGVNK